MKTFGVCLLVVAGLSGATVCQSVNLLINPGFETWIDTLGIQMPLGWATSGLVDPNSAYRSTRAHSGSFSLALGQTGSTPGLATTAAFIVGGTHYDLSVWYDIPAFIGSGTVSLTQFDSNDSMVGSDLGFLPFTMGWTQYTLGIDAEPGAVLAVLLFTGVSDTAFLDDAVFDGEPGTGVNERKPIHTVATGPLLNISPNPCRGSAKVVAILDHPGSSEMRIYDTSGRLVRRYAVSGTGPVTVEWDGRDYASRAVPSGAYFVRLDSGSKTVCERITVIR